MLSHFLPNRRSKLYTYRKYRKIYDGYSILSDIMMRVDKRAKKGYRTERERDKERVEIERGMDRAERGVMLWIDTEKE